jgi:predicted NBD/HSP70 family sugar kinase
MSRIGNQQVSKEINKSLLLHLIYHHGPISRIELARLTKLSPTTVSVLIEEKIREGIVHEVGTTSSGLGRKMKMLSIKANHGYILGVDLSNSPGRMVLLDMQGEIIATYEFERLIGVEAICGRLPALIQSFLNGQNLKNEQVLSLGLSVPGSIDEERKIVIHSNSLKMENVPLESILQESTGIPIHLVNDLDAAGFAERFSGAAKEVGTIVYLLIGYGVGAGLVINHQIFRGNLGQAGRTGEMYPFGTLVLSERLRISYPDEFVPDLNPEDIIIAFLQRGLTGEEPFKKELDMIIHTISKYCGTVLQFLNPQKLILNGWVVKNETLFMELTRLIQHYENSPGKPTAVEASYWKELGAAVGAATLGLHEIFKLKTVE